MTINSLYESETPRHPRCPSRAFSLHAHEAPLEGGQDPAYGSVRWRTLVDGHGEAPSELVFGVAEFEPGGTLLAHRHKQAEVYFGLEGSGTVTIDGIDHPIASGVVIWVPGNVEHATHAGPEGLRFAYAFAERSFAEIAYQFTGAIAAG